MAGPLDGVKILDLTTVGFGPYAGQILGDYGADIIKIESHEGDITRGISPFKNPGMGHFYLMANRNKRSIVLDLKKPEGRDAVLKLAEGADAVLTSIRPAAMQRLGLGYEDFTAVNSKIIYVALVGFGQDGPYAKRPAYDDVIQGLSGMADMQGGRSGEPAFIKASVCDKICSQFAVHAMIAALFSRERSGEGQLVEVPMLESMVGFNLVEHQSGQTFDPPLGPVGYERSMVEYRRPYQTADGFICVLPYNTKQWRSFSRVNDGKTRSEKIGELYEMVAECVRDWPTEPLLKALHTADIPHGKATPLGNLADDPHLGAVGMFEHFDHPTEGRIRLVRPGVRFEKTPASIRTLPVALGADGEALLREAGYSSSHIARMIDDGVTVAAAPSEARSAAE
jgi:crotonobetainyl-CoA:carnitine CoA-transferase CaiB-like acyl-CoA transferase